MLSDQFIFAGVDISSGRKPVTFAALDGALNVVSLEKLDIAGVALSLEKSENILLAVNRPSPSRDQEIYTEFKNTLTLAGFTYYSRKTNKKQWFETNSQDCFRALNGRNLLSRRALEGRLQRILILYDQELQIDDPMEIFEEITRYKLMQGILPFANVYSSKELDALAAAYVTWMVVNRLDQVSFEAGIVLPSSE